jgi:hypothetical protein
VSLYAKFFGFGVLSPLLLLSGDGEGWNRLFHGGSVEDEGGNFGVSIFIDMTT